MIMNFDYQKAIYKATELGEWYKWIDKIPFIQLPNYLQIKIIPPFSGAIVRFGVCDINNPESYVSVYLDCYDLLGWFDEPYWEIYPYENDVYRIEMNDADGLVKAIKYSIDLQNEKYNEV